MSFWQKKWILISSILLILYAVYLRCFELVSTSIWMDEGYSINVAISIWQKGWPILDSGRYYLNGIVYHYLLAGIYGIFGINIFWMRILSVILGLIASMIIFLVTKKITKSNLTGYLTFFICLFSYWQIAWSRQIRMYELVLVLLWLSIYFFWQIINNNNLWRNILLSALFLIMSTINHPVALLILPSYLIIFWLYFPNRKLKYRIMSGLMGLAVLWQVIGYFTVYRNNTIFYLVKNNFSFHFYLPSFLEFMGSSYFVIGSLSVLAIIWFGLNKKYLKPTIFLASIYLFPFIIFSFFFNTLIFRYLFVFSPALFILVAMFLSEIIKSFKSKTKAYLLVMAILALMIYTGELVFVPRAFYKLESNPENSNKTYLSYTPQPNFKVAYENIKSNLENNTKVISAYPHLTKIFLNEPGYWIKFDYIGSERQDYYVNQENREYYVGAEVINNLSELESLLSSNKVMIVYDRMARDRIDAEIINFIEQNMTLLYHDEVNKYSEVWVYGSQ